MTAAFAQAGAPPLYPVPTAQQAAWQEMEFVVFAHFGVNTFTDREWGEGTEDPAIFNPTEFDARQWVSAIKDAGAKLLILTCKHHDGFCLWPSAYTEHSVKNSPWRGGKGDVVKEVSTACHEAGIKFGVYLSPWDRHEKTYGDSPRYNQHFLNQLRELLTKYGEVAEVWFDGANGEGPNGKRQEYDLTAYYSLIRELQPNAVIAIMGPDVRWVGNESGVAAETEWSVRVVSAKGLDDPRTVFNKTVCEGPVQYLLDGNKLQKDVSFSHLTGDASNLGERAPLMWYPAETDVSIRPGWFYHAKEDDKVKSLDHLLDIYYNSIGRNSVLLLNIPPDRRGLMHENDVKRLKEWRGAIDKTFKTNLAAKGEVKTGGILSDGFGGGKLIDDNNATYWAPEYGAQGPSFEIELPAPVRFDVIELREPIRLGQRVAGFTVEAWLGDEWKTIAEGTTVGYKRLMRVDPVETAKVRVTIGKSRGLPLLSQFGLYKQPE
ncbi:MAG: alpha-fucosidase [bacterium]|nr:alpha-fucosidase [bacterium]